MIKYFNFCIAPLPMELPAAMLPGIFDFLYPFKDERLLISKCRVMKHFLRVQGLMLLCISMIFELAAERTYPSILLSANKRINQSAFICATPEKRMVISQAPQLFDTGVNVPQTNLNIPEEQSASKSCACQVLNVSSKNQRNLRIAILVEKSGIEKNADKILIKQLFEKEKRYMRYFFYEEMKTVRNMIVRTDCKTLYKKLQSANRGLRLYQVLDADIKQNL